MIEIERVERVVGDMYKNRKRRGKHLAWPEPTYAVVMFRWQPGCLLSERGTSRATVERLLKIEFERVRRGSGFKK